MDTAARVSPGVKTPDPSAQAQAVAVGAAVECTVDAADAARREILTRNCELWLDKARARKRAAEVFTQNDPVRRLGAAAVW